MHVHAQVRGEAEGERQGGGKDFEADSTLSMETAGAASHNPP